jgi:hypothetical protein
MDLDGDRVEEKLILLYTWGKWSHDRIEAQERYLTELSGTDSWTANGLLIARRTQDGWEPCSYQFEEYDGFGISREKRQGLPDLLVAGGGRDHRVWAWGVRALGDNPGYLPAYPTRQYGLSDRLPQFEIDDPEIPK